MKFCIDCGEGVSPRALRCDSCRKGWAVEKAKRRYQKHRAEVLLQVKARTTSLTGDAKEDYLRKRREHERAKYKSDPERAYARAIRKLYGLTWDRYLAMRLAQNESCAICQKSFADRRPCVDHDHATGAVRALLCASCNKMLGTAQDSPGILRAGANYLEIHGK